MKTWEMIKELMENPNKKFATKSYSPEYCYVYRSGKGIRWYPDHSFLSLGENLFWEWEEIQNSNN